MRQRRDFVKSESESRWRRKVPPRYSHDAHNSSRHLEIKAVSLHHCCCGDLCISSKASGSHTCALIKTGLWHAEWIAHLLTLPVTHTCTHTADYPATLMGHNKAADCCYGSYRDEEEGGGMMRWWAQTPTTKRKKQCLCVALASEKEEHQPWLSLHPCF